MKEGTAHNSQVKRLKRIEGQVRGITGMIEESRYCIDILTQIKAIKSALVSVESNIVKEHLSHCVKEALTSKNQAQSNEMIEEITTLLSSTR